jgi:ubiquinone/menaquinone biosynthesis C-methylase UbiE
MADERSVLEWAGAWEAAFERCALAYSENVAPILASFAEGAVEGAAITRGARVLDVACGSGIVTRAAAQRASDTGTVVGVDTSPTMLRSARAAASREAAGSRARFAAASARALPFPSATFDAVVSSFGLPLSGTHSELEECVRVLKPGGLLSLVHFGPEFIEPLFEVSRILRRHRTNEPSQFLAMYRDLSYRVERQFHERRSPEALALQLEGAGLAIVDIHKVPVRQRMWGIMNFVDFALSFPLNYLEHAEMSLDARAAFHRDCQAELKKHMDLEEFIAPANLVFAVARRPAQGG